MRTAAHPFRHRWNHNTHYYPLIASQLPASAALVADVGCGDGTLAEYLRSADRQVIGCDIDRSVLPIDAGYVAGSLLELPFASGSLDAVTAVMTLHHVNLPAGLAELRRVLRPGGTLLVLGYGSYGGPRDLPAEVRDVLAHRWLRRGMVDWEPPTAKADPPLTWAATRHALRAELPGCRFRRLPMWRYLLRWQRR